MTDLLKEFTDALVEELRVRDIANVNKPDFPLEATVQQFTVGPFSLVDTTHLCPTCQQMKPNSPPPVPLVNRLVRAVIKTLAKEFKIYQATRLKFTPSLRIECHGGATVVFCDMMLWIAQEALIMESYRQW